MFNRNFADVFADWLADFDRIRGGDLSDIERDCYAKPGMVPLVEWLHDEGVPPDPATHRPWRDEDATWVQVWETVSEGTPVTPPFATKEELVDYLVAGGDDWDRECGTGGYSRKQAEAFVKAGWVPSMMAVMKDGVMTDITTGIASAGSFGDDGATSCDWCAEHDAVTYAPIGPPCGAPATHRIVWLDGSGRHSFGCRAHLELDSEATAHRIEPIEVSR